VVTRHGAVVVEPYPFGFLIQPFANRDLKVTDLPVVEFIALGWLVEGLFVVEYPLLQVVDVILVALGGHAGTRLSIGDGLEEPISDAT
jgi:hypothetical protein